MLGFSCALSALSNCGWQVESVKLSSESERRGMQVELANSRKEAAAAAAKLKHELANWQVGWRGML